MHTSGQVVSIEQTGDSNQKSLASKTPDLVYANEEYSTATDKTELFLYSMYAQEQRQRRGINHSVAFTVKRF